ncbi:MAG: ion channel [Smithellaceae bacterium]|nr:ion channel [Smithellaceae bacterium]
MSSLVRILRGLRRFGRERLVLVSIVTLLIIFASAAGVYYFEQTSEGSNISSFWDGVWWAIVTMGTVGYGDKYPVSIGGRVVGLLLIFSGVGLMSLFTATIASMFVEKRIREGKGLDTIKDKDHIVICGWNQHTEEVLQGLTAYGSLEEARVVLINELSVDDIDALRMKYAKYDLRFLRGNYVHEDVLLRANIARARFALIMADISGGQAEERIDERTTLTALAIKSIAPQVKIIAELLDHENKPHLKRANVDEIIIRGEHVGALLASAVNSPGLPRVFSSVLSLGDTSKLRRYEVPKQFVGRNFRELSSYFRERHQAILIGFLKEKQKVRVEDILSDNSSAIDSFIREKIKEAKKDFFYESDESRVVINPDDNYIIGINDFAVVLSGNNQKKDRGNK